MHGEGGLFAVMGPDRVIQIRSWRVKSSSKRNKGTQGQRQLSPIPTPESVSIGVVRGETGGVALPVGCFSINAVPPFDSTLTL